MGAAIPFVEGVDMVQGYEMWRQALDKEGLRKIFQGVLGSKLVKKFLQFLPQT